MAVSATTIASEQVTADRAAAQYGIRPEILKGLLETESSWDPNAVGHYAAGPPYYGAPSGALGVAQFIPGTAASYNVVPTDPNSAIPGAARYLSDLLAQFGGDYRSALIAYNAGPENAKKILAGGSVPGADSEYVATVARNAMKYTPAGREIAAQQRFLVLSPRTAAAAKAQFDSSNLGNVLTKLAQNAALLAIALALIAGGFVWLAAPEIRDGAKAAAVAA